ncbi:hypothetical protein M5K25_001312 [Dendrobium thyrsiflorum]|uniref:Uncharacterized protein n=1 Tax=Dendrobium thyrsiflorum TaxID=117978 RepID=A0ABD0VPY4_DENTH
MIPLVFAWDTRGWLVLKIQDDQITSSRTGRTGRLAAAATATAGRTARAAQLARAARGVARPRPAWPTAPEPVRPVRTRPARPAPDPLPARPARAWPARFRAPLGQARPSPGPVQAASPVQAQAPLYKKEHSFMQEILRPIEIRSLLITEVGEKCSQWKEDLRAVVGKRRRSEVRTYPRLYVRALLDDVNLCGRGRENPPRMYNLSEVYQQVHYPGVIVDVFLAEEDESLLEDVRVELLQFLADLVGEELPPVAVVPAVESLAGVEGSRYETPPSFEFSLLGRVPRFLLQLHFAPQGRKKQISNSGVIWNLDRIPGSLRNPAVVEEEFLLSFPSSLLFFFFSLGVPLLGEMRALFIDFCEWHGS